MGTKYFPWGKKAVLYSDRFFFYCFTEIVTYIDVADLLGVDGEKLSAGPELRVLRLVLDQEGAGPELGDATPGEAVLRAERRSAEAEARLAAVRVVGAQPEGAVAAGVTPVAHHVRLAAALAAVVALTAARRLIAAGRLSAAGVALAGPAVGVAEVAVLARVAARAREATAARTLSRARLALSLVGPHRVARARLEHNEPC